MDMEPRASDFFCSVSGARYFSSTSEFLDHLSYIDDNFELQPEESYDDLGARYFSETDEFSMELSDRLQKGLQYSDEDVESSSKFVLLCPYEILEDGKTMIKYTNANDPHPTDYTESTITEVFDVFTGDDPGLGDYEDIDEEVFSVLPDGNNLIVTYTSYLILKQAAPEVKPHILYSLAFGRNRGTMGEVFGIDYGPVGRIIRQPALWAAICGNGFENPVTFWRQLLRNKEQSDEDILHEAWKGRGNMWVFVRPDRFPIAETLAAKPMPSFPYLVSAEPNIQNPSPTFASFPPDVLLSTCEFLPIRSMYALIATCRKFRSAILPHANAIARRRLIDDEPWYLPVGPFDLNSTNADRERVHTEMRGRKEMNGREEIEWWAEQWAAGGISQEDMVVKIPWFVYRKECSKSMSMWNRKRIWGISKQLDALARVKGLL